MVGRRGGAVGIGSGCFTTRGSALSAGCIPICSAGGSTRAGISVIGAGPAGWAGLFPPPVGVAPGVSRSGTFVCSLSETVRFNAWSARFGAAAGAGVGSGALPMSKSDSRAPSMRTSNRGLTLPSASRTKSIARTGSMVLGRTIRRIWPLLGHRPERVSRSAGPGSRGPRVFEIYMPRTSSGSALAVSSRAFSSSSLVSRKPGPRACRHGISMRCRIWRWFPRLAPASRPPTPIPTRGSASKPSSASRRIASSALRDAASSRAISGSCEASPVFNAN